MQPNDDGLSVKEHVGEPDYRIRPKHLATWFSKCCLAYAGSMFCCLAAVTHLRAEGPGLLEVKSFRNQELQRYADLSNRVSHAWTIPGLAAGFVPQGIAFVPGTDLVLLSGYKGLSFSKGWLRVMACVPMVQIERWFYGQA